MKQQGNGRDERGRRARFACSFGRRRRSNCGSAPPVGEGGGGWEGKWRVDELNVCVFVCLCVCMYVCFCVSMCVCCYVSML